MERAKWKLLAAALVVAGCWLTGPVHAEEPTATDQVPTVVKQVPLSPQAIGSPILAHRLLPAEHELKEGNAALVMLRVPHENGALVSIYEKLQPYVGLTPEDPQWRQLSINGLLPRQVIDDYHVAARIRTAEWGYFSYGEPLHRIRLNDAQALRAPLAWGLPVTARWRLHEGQFDEGLLATRAGLGCARHIARTPFLVAQLIAASYCQANLDTLQWWVAAEGSPNLYWSLAALPQPLLFPREAADFEAAMVERTAPEVDRLDQLRDEDQWDDLLYQTARALQGQPDLEEDAIDLVVSGFATRARELFAKSPGPSI